jgi:hypothetical protein
MCNMAPAKTNRVQKGKQNTARTKAGGAGGGEWIEQIRQIGQIRQLGPQILLQIWTVSTRRFCIATTG